MSHILITVDNGEISYSIHDTEYEAENQLIEDLEDNYPTIEIPDMYTQAIICDAIGEADINYLFLIREIIT